jgi:hypothetical protein
MLQVMRFRYLSGVSCGNITGSVVLCVSKPVQM